MMEKIEYTLSDFHSSDNKCTGTLADLMLDALLIPPCGLVPPFRVTAAIFRSGGGNAGMSPGCSWKPFNLKEEDYWKAIGHLESLTPDDLASRYRNPHIRSEIRPDYSAPDTDDYTAWLKSLTHRGYLP